MKSFKSVLFLLGLSCITATLVSCEKDPEIIFQTETITIIDTVYVLDTVTVIETIIETIPDTGTTFLLVRHAETTGSGSNPGLSSIGQTRAMDLARILGNVPLDAVFSTNFNRTMQTAAPIASDQMLSVQSYDPFDPNGFIDNALADYRHGFVLVVGHSNTTPDFVNAMLGDDIYSDLSESEYDNLFMVTLFEKGRGQVVHMKYGE